MPEDKPKEAPEDAVAVVEKKGDKKSPLMKFAVIFGVGLVIQLIALVVWMNGFGPSEDGDDGSANADIDKENYEIKNIVFTLPMGPTGRTAESIKVGPEI